MCCKRIFSSLIFTIFIFSGSILAEEHLVTSGSDLQDAINSAQSGDVLILEDGGVYDQSTNVTSANLAISGMDITIKAEDDAVTKPEVLFAGFNIDGELNAVTLQGIKFTSKYTDGSRTSYFINFTEAFVYAYHLKVLDCEADGFKRCVLRADRVSSTCDSLVFDNDIFTNLDESYRLFHFGGNLEYNYFQLTNTTVANFTEAIIWSSSFSQKEVIIDNCTFDGMSVVNPSVLTLDGDPGSYIRITDCLLTNFASGKLFNMEFLADTVKFTRFYNIGDTTNAWDYKEDFIEEDPMYADRANMNFTLPENSELRTAGTNGGPIGDPRWAGGATALPENNKVIPDQFVLQQNYPNPFNPATTINYSLPEAGLTKLDIFDVSGKHIASLVNGIQTQGQHSVIFNAENLANGLYFYRLSMDDNMQVKRMILIK